MTFLQQELTDNELLRSIWAALRRIEEGIGQPLIVGPPVVEVPPPDLSDIVNAVMSLNGTGPSADEIARAIAESLRFPTPEPDESLEKVALALEKVSNQLKGIGNQQFGGGGGSVTFQPGQKVDIGNWEEMPASSAPEVQRVKDDYQTGEILPDQAGTNGVLTFIFSGPVHLLVLESVGGTSRANPFGGVPTAALGIPLRDATPTYLPVQTDTVRVYAPGTATVHCYGLRRV